MENTMNRPDGGHANILHEFATRLRVWIQAFLACFAAAVREARQSEAAGLARKAFRQ